MKTLVFGPSGTGKTYVSKALKLKGINAFDADDITGLSAWYNQFGEKISAPLTADEALKNNYSFLWSKKALRQFLVQFSEVYIFGGSGNLFDVLPLFEKAYFLHIKPELQLERLKSVDRQTPFLDHDANGMVIWGDWLAAEARKRGITFIEADQTPEQIFEQISQPIP